MTLRPRRPVVTGPALLPVVLATVLAMTLGACSGGDDGDADPSGGAGADPAGAEGAEDGACGLLGADEVGGLFGEDARPVPPEGAPVTCVWESGSGEGLPTQQLQVSLFEGQEPITAAEYGEGAQMVEGVGDEAFVTDGPLGPTAVANLGDTSVMLIYVPPLDQGDGADDTSADLVELLTLAAGRAEAP